MIKIAKQRAIQFGYVGIDGGYGNEPHGASLNKVVDL
jgi:hypothetical protein